MKALHEYKKSELDLLPDHIKSAIDVLMSSGMKKYEINVRKDYGDFFIILSWPILKYKQLNYLMKFIESEFTIGIFPEISKSTLCLRFKTK
tara:strand:+ start:16937 stop:17209 length:273 start_codon:yes stop_codon:yes gene_type:complete